MKPVSNLFCRRSVTPPGAALRSLAGAWLVLISALLVGCSGSSGPTIPVNISFDYLPSAVDLELTISQNLFFKVNAPANTDFSVNWFVNGNNVFQGHTFTYFPATLGVDTLRAEVRSGTVQDDRQWQIRVVSTQNDLPPEVIPVILEDGLLPGEVSARWLGVTGTASPIRDYIVAMSYNGPLNVVNWNEAALQDTVPHDNKLEYQRTYLLNYGQNVWFAVRARDERQVMSDITHAYARAVTYPWTLGVSIVDDRVAPVPQVIVKWTAIGVNYSGSTQGSGFLEIGPFRNIDRITLETQINNDGVIGEYYDYRDPAISIEEGTELDITLMPHFGLDESCDAGFNEKFLTYFRYMTTTDRESVLRPNYRLLKWAEYPLQVYVPARENAFGLEMRPAVLDAMQAWNTVMGETYFELVETSSAADIVFYFPSLQAYGLTTIVEPSDKDYSLGSVVPELVSIEIDSSRDTGRSTLVMVSMHELGHALGISRHAPCNGPAYLMYTSYASSIDDENGGIHPDEQNMVRMIRNLPQATDMSLYVLD